MGICRSQSSIYRQSEIYCDIQYLHCSLFIYKRFLRKEGKYFGLMPFNIILKFSWDGNLLAYTLIEDTSIT